MKNFIQASYLLIIGFILGFEIACTALISPIIFYPDKFLGSGVLSRFHSGLLMTEVFLRLNIVLLIILPLLWFFEIYSSFKIKKDLIALLILIFISITIFLFVFYFTPYIVDAQAAKTTKTEEFATIHKLSVLDMKTLMLFQLVLFFKKTIFYFSKKSK